MTPDPLLDLASDIVRALAEKSDAESPHSVIRARLAALLGEPIGVCVACGGEEISPKSAMHQPGVAAFKKIGAHAYVPALRYTVTTPTP